MQQQIDNGSTPTPEPSAPTPQTIAAALDAPASQPKSETPAPQPAPQSADQARLSQIESEIASLERLAADATTGRKRREYLEQRSALQQERTELQMKPVHEHAAEVERQANADFKAAQEAAAAERVECDVPVSAKHTEIVAQYVEDANGIADVANIPKAEMSLLMNHIIGDVVAAVARDEASGLAQGQIPGPDLARKDQCLGILRHKFGSMTEQVVEQAAKGFAKLPKSVQVYLDTPAADGSLLSNSPQVVEALWLWGSGYSSLSPESAAKELAGLRASKQYLQKDGLTLSKVGILSAIVAQGKAKADKLQPMPQAAPKQTATERSKIEDRVAAIRRDPNYFSNSNPKLHRALVDEMAGLFQRLHPEAR